MGIEIKQGTFEFQRRFYDESFLAGENPYGAGRMQDLLQNLRINQVKAYVNPGSKFLDVGAGLGESADAAQRVGGIVTSIDISGEALLRLREKNPNTNPVLADAIHLPFVDNSFDVVSLYEVLEHTNSPRELLTELHRVIKPEGILLLSTPNANSLNRRLKLLFMRATGRLDGTDPNNLTSRPEHFREYKYNETISLLEESGFYIRDWQGYGLCFPPAWKVQSVKILSPLIDAHVYSGQLAKQFAQETYVVATAKKNEILGKEE